MANLNKVIGQNHIMDHFVNAIKMDKISHAYIINGEELSGKKDLALSFAMALQCQEPPTGGACMGCRSCKQAMSGNHPDIKWITYEKTGIGVDEIREQINNDIDIKPYSSRRKIYIVPDAEKMTVQAQNALLKTIEEPPSYAVIILLTTNADMFLQTILSRCVVLNIRAVKEEIIKNYLQAEFGISKYEAGIATAFSEGNPGKAVKLATSEEFALLCNNVVSTIDSIIAGSMTDIANAIKTASEHKDDINQYLALIRVWFRDVLLYKSTENKDKLIFQNEISTIVHMSQMWDYDGINAILKALDNVESRLKYNVNFEATMEVLFLGIKEHVVPERNM